MRSKGTLVTLASRLTGGPNWARASAERARSKHACIFIYRQHLSLEVPVPQTSHTVQVMLSLCGWAAQCYRSSGLRYSQGMKSKLSLLLCAGALFAADAPQKTFPFPYTQEDLPNGLRVVTIPTDFPNIVSIFIVVQTGSRNEVEPGKTGFAHLFEHVMFKGT